MRPELKDNQYDLSCLLAREIGWERVIVDENIKLNYGKDNSIAGYHPFDVLVKPANAFDIASVLRICSAHDVPVTPRGGGSGVTGGALPVRGGVVLSLEGLSRIIEIEEVEGYVVAEAGVITADLCKAVEEKHLMYPVAPSSASFSFIGGNVAENAGSVRSCKYGMTSEYVMNLEVVSPDGRIFWTGSNRRKNSTGIDLTHLFVGSEGILGVISKVVLRLLPLPAIKTVLLAGYATLEDACKAIVAIRQSRLQPSAAELICENALRITAEYLGAAEPLVKDGISTHVLLELEAGDTHQMDEMIGLASTILAEDAVGRILQDKGPMEGSGLGKVRFSIGNAMTTRGRFYRDIDACVPLLRLNEYIRYMENVCKNSHISLVCFGHAMDGNVHAMLLFDSLHDLDRANQIDCIAEKIYAKAVAIGGVISGEHGIGCLQKEFVKLQFDQVRIGLMQQVKALFDPSGILNPGKVF
jgi:glycolate oxidase